MKYIFILVSVLLSASVSAQQGQPQAPSDVFERAMIEAKRQASLQRPKQPQLPGQGTRPADPLAMAEKYRTGGGSYGLDKPADELLVFISLSMPIETLKRLGAQVKTTGGILVLRGVKDGMSKGNFNKMMITMKPVAETGANIQIDPEAFAKYQVTAVPTFVLAKQAEGCASEVCGVASKTYAGDVSLDYVLEKMAADNGSLAGLAQEKLELLKGRNR